jgi:uroporphyrinogen III methyltransferase/synthase
LIDRPLAGKRIVITRARRQASTLKASLEGLGAEVIGLPTIEICEPENWQPLDNALQQLATFDYLLLTSVNGVKSLLARLEQNGRTISDLNALAIGAIGPATAAALRTAGVHVDFVPAEYRAEGLLQVLASRPIAGRSFLIPRAKVARDLVPRVLIERGARVVVVEAYRTAIPDLPAEEVERRLRAANNARPQLITFTSSSTASNLAAILGVEKLRMLLEGVATASIGPITSQTLQGLGIEPDIEAAESTIPGLVKSIREYFIQVKS